MKRLLLAFSLFCAVTSASAQSSSGRPEVTIKAPVATAMNVAIKLMHDDGWRLAGQTPYSSIFEKDETNLILNMLASTPAGGLPIDRVTYTVIDNGGMTRMYGNFALVSNHGTSFETVPDATSGNAAAGIQANLNYIAKHAEIAAHGMAIAPANAAPRKGRYSTH